MLYKIVRIIGKGGTSTVYEAKYEGKPIAIKRILKENQALAENEISFLQSLSHPYIVKLRDVIHREHDTLLLFDLHDSSSLLFNEHLTENTVLKIVRMVLQALEYMHRSNVMHRDIKLENVLLTKTHIKICDFGLAASRDEHYTYCGTRKYMAPEMGGKYDELIDVYGVGLLMYKLLRGVTMDKERVIDIDALNISYLARDLLKQLLSEKEQRPSADGALKHPAFSIFYPQMCDYFVLPDFKKNVRIGELVKEGKAIKLVNYKIVGDIFFKNEQPIGKHLVLHGDLRIFNYMLVIAGIYLKRMQHTHANAPNDGHLSMFDRSALTSTHAWADTSYVIPQLKYFYHNNWLVFNTMSYSVTLLLQGTRIECCAEEMYVYQSKTCVKYLFSSLLDGSDPINTKLLKMLEEVLAILVEMRKSYR
ncbi:serine/threonine protein kinase [Vavraia culicis subsp. floridensis]|uniref:Serine/threonine protein kinase n=1 Tax=Vavraia culicis (isolate floridensis) TaxID=948595 RepID=L2GXA6_VAVCU|nr:serine/threonine protein kinase [Vavraia culicis subsp. floridensis]ELA47982.1 serine/threonine protein kinase [Vavraia culicis subsp. floridensis]